MKIYLTENLTDQELIDYCDFDQSDFDVGNQSQIDFIIVCDYYIETLPYPLHRHIQLHSVERINKILNEIQTTIFVFWH
jgi:hypothetical protein